MGEKIKGVIEYLITLPAVSGLAGPVGLVVGIPFFIDGARSAYCEKEPYIIQLVRKLFGRGKQVANYKNYENIARNMVEKIT